MCEERAELVYERIRRRTQFIITAASVASTEEMKRLDQCLEDLMKHMGYSEFGSSLRSIENFPANRYIIKPAKKKFQTFKQAEASQCYGSGDQYSKREDTDKFFWRLIC
ncbi:hypothetical protein TNCV_4492851 [Trichonephila clavipes]|uniref:Uncharacterized protein n=1 Tax=Trichonephila clavipes TaxID=2585209 RepID=A0A8X6SJU3_TRICX|nr:hypothetical protein TNCV_4492851 [Trichonephila clavipes]